MCTKKDEEIAVYETNAEYIQKVLKVRPRGDLPICSSGLQVSSSDGIRASGHRRRKSAVQMHDIAPSTAEPQRLSRAAIESVANASFTSSDSGQHESTPKRSKPRFKIPKMTTPHGKRAGQPPLSRSKRSTLTAVTPNRKHTTVGLALSEDCDDENGGISKRRGSPRSMSDDSFDMGRLLVGTPFATGEIICGTGRAPTDEEDGVTEL